MKLVNDCFCPITDCPVLFRAVMKVALTKVVLRHFADIDPD